MCWAVGCLLFGVWVKSSDLKFAAEAYDRVKAPLKALELIKQRQRTGVLLCKDQETRKTVRDFSREIWSRIGQHLIDGEIEAAEQEAIRGYRCPGCAIVMNVDEGRRWAGWADKNAERKGEVWRSGWEPSCEYCMEGVYEGDPFEKPDFVSAYISLPTFPFLHIPSWPSLSGLSAHFSLGVRSPHRR